MAGGTPAAAGNAAARRTASTHAHATDRRRFGCFGLTNPSLRDPAVALNQPELREVMVDVLEVAA